MNGGVLNAVEVNDDAYLSAAEEGYRWLGLGQIADLVREVRRAVASGQAEDLAQAEVLEEESDERYSRVLPADEDLEAALRRRVLDSPAAFR